MWLFAATAPADHSRHSSECRSEIGKSDCTVPPLARYVISMQSDAVRSVVLATVLSPMKPSPVGSCTPLPLASHPVSAKNQYEVPLNSTLDPLSWPSTLPLLFARGN